MSDKDHLKSGHIDNIALQLAEDVYDSDFNREEIMDRLMRAIVARCNYPHVAVSGVADDFIVMSVEEHAHKPALTLHQAASLILSVWEYMDREKYEFANLSDSMKKPGG